MLIRLPLPQCFCPRGRKLRPWSKKNSDQNSDHPRLCIYWGKEKLRPWSEFLGRENSDHGLSFGCFWGRGRWGGSLKATLGRARLAKAVTSKTTALKMPRDSVGWTCWKPSVKGCKWLGWPCPNLDGPIRANRFADSRESLDSHESFQGSRTEPFFLRIALRRAKIFESQVGGDSFESLARYEEVFLRIDSRESPRFASRIAGTSQCPKLGPIVRWSFSRHALDAPQQQEKHCIPSWKESHILCDTCRWRASKENDIAGA